MKRIWFTVLTLVSAMSLSAGPKNVVLFVADDLGKDLGCYGNHVIQTPHIDSMAKEATVFSHAFATTASCSASRSVILTGLHNHANAHYGHQHHYHHFSSYGWIHSLPVLMKKGGYRTARVGKYHVAPEDVYKFDQAIPGNSRDVVTMVNNSKKFLSANEEQPFFLYICTSDPHRSGEIAEEDSEKPNRFGNKKSGSYPGITPVTYNPKEVIVPPFLPDTAATRSELAQYYQSVSRIDQGFGHLVKTLKELGAYEDTLIILISDHGIAMPGGKTTTYEPGLNAPCIVRMPGAKRRGITNPALVSWVDLAPTILDFARVLERKSGTIPAAIATAPQNIHRNAGKRIPYRFHGRSFLGVIDDPEAEGWNTVYGSHTFHEIQMYYPMRVVRERRYKLIWNIAHPLPFPFASDLWVAPTWQRQYEQGTTARYGVRSVGEYIHRPEFEMFDLKNDPTESKNLALIPQHTELLERLKGKLKSFQQRTQDPWLMKWKYE